MDEKKPTKNWGELKNKNNSSVASFNAYKSRFSNGNLEYYNEPLFNSLSLLGLCKNGIKNDSLALQRKIQ